MFPDASNTLIFPKWKAGPIFGYPCQSEATISYVGWASCNLAAIDEDGYGSDDQTGCRDMDASMGASMGLGLSTF